MAKKITPPAEILDRLNKVLESCGETRQYLADCKDCGLDVDREIRVNDEQADVAKRIKAKFYPRAK